MFSHSILIGAAAVALSANASLAQTDGTYVITFDGVVTPQNPTMTVGLWATWVDPNRGYVFGGGNYDLAAGDGEFVSGVNILNGPGSTIGVLSGNTVSGGANGQIHGILGIFGNPDNPILLATYEWTTTDFTPRTIDFETSNTTHFIVADFVTGATTQLYPNQFSPGHSVYVIPATGPLGLLGIGVVLASGRRRKRALIPVGKTLASGSDCGTLNGYLLADRNQPMLAG